MRILIDECLNSTEPLNRLNYETAISLRLWRLRRLCQIARRALLVVLVAAAGWLVVEQAPNVWARILMHRALAACSIYSASPDLAVFESDPTSVAKLKGNAAYTFETREVDPTCALFHARCLTTLDQCTGGALSGPMSRPAATVFLHELRTEGGTRRLVRVMYAHCLAHSAGNDFFTFDTAMLNTSAGFQKPAWVDVDTDPSGSEFRRALSGKTWRQGGNPTIYCGQMDPFNPARFSIRCHQGSEDGFLEGWLEDTPSGPAVRLHARDGSNMSPQDRVVFSQQLEQYSPSPSEVVFEDEPTKAAQLLSAGAGLYVNPPWWEEDKAEAALVAPPVWRDHYVPFPSERVKVWRPNQWWDGPVLFLGGRSAGGFNRILRVDLDGSIDRSAKRMWPEMLLVTVFSAATPNSQILIVGEPKRTVSWGPLKKPIRFYAGQRDANDASHFTIGFDYDCKIGALHGWLLPDGASVRLKGWPERSPYDAPDEITSRPGD